MATTKPVDVRQLSAADYAKAKTQAIRTSSRTTAERDARALAAAQKRFTPKGPAK